MLTYLTALKLKVQNALNPRTPPADVSDTEHGSGLVECEFDLAHLSWVGLQIAIQLRYKPLDAALPFMIE